MSSKLKQLVQQVADLSLQRYPDLPGNMYIPKYEPAQLAQVLGFVPPEELEALYCTGVLMNEPWARISLDQPAETPKAFGYLNDHLRDHTPPVKVQPGVKLPVVFGEKLIPFAYYDDSHYCVDMDPDLAAKGVLKQIVNVSMRKGLAKVAFPHLEAFLADGLKKMKREIELEDAEDAGDSGEAVGAAPEMTPEQVAEMLRDPVAYFQNLTNTLRQALPGVAAAARAPAWTDAERAQRVASLIASNPQRTPLQRVCAALIQAYGRDPEFDGFLQQTLPPMPAAKREKIERALGVKFPPDLHEFLDAHQLVPIAWDDVDCIGIDDNIARICKDLKASTGIPADEWGLWPGTAAPVFGKGLLPMGDPGDPIVSYDLAPGAGGRVGQLVEAFMEDSSCKVIAASLLEFLSDGLGKLKSGRPAE